MVVSRRSNVWCGNQQTNTLDTLQGRTHPLCKRCGAFNVFLTYYSPECFPYCEQPNCHCEYSLCTRNRYIVPYIRKAFPTKSYSKERKGAQRKP